MKTIEKISGQINTAILIEALKYYKGSITDTDKIKSINETIKSFEASLPVKKVLTRRHKKINPDKVYYLLL